MTVRDSRVEEVESVDELGLFTAALGLSEPWRVARTEFDAEGARLDLYLEFGRGAQFPCPAKDCAHGGCPVHDTAAKTWQHLDFFQHKAFLHARAPRVRCPEHGVLGGHRRTVFDSDEAAVRGEQLLAHRGGAVGDAAWQPDRGTPGGRAWWDLCSDTTDAGSVRRGCRPRG